MTLRADSRNKTILNNNQKYKNNSNFFYFHNIAQFEAQLPQITSIPFFYQIGRSLKKPKMAQIHDLLMKKLN